MTDNANGIIVDLTNADTNVELSGFSGAEPGGRWTEGTQATIVLSLTNIDFKSVSLAVEAAPFLPAGVSEPQRVDVAVSGRRYRKWVLNTSNRYELAEFYVNLEGVSGDELTIELSITKCRRPSDFGVSDDQRCLGVIVKTISMHDCDGRLSLDKYIRDKGPLAAHPYADLPDANYWRRSISAVETHRVDPVTQARFKISPESRVGTAGSCFAQHIARKLSETGFNYFVTEPGLHVPAELRRRHNYGVFSARYGNVYTTPQLSQLFDEAFEQRLPEERAWIRSDGRFVDPYRQQVEPNGFENAAALVADREQHLDAVRRVFMDSDVFIFTLGLTEAWRSKSDGSVYSAAPGVIANQFDENQHEFVNFSLEQVYEALESFLTKLKDINPQVNVLLTVSPVPLVATFEPRSVLVSTTYSKSVLRVAAEMALKKVDWVDYFPSYEIITGSFSGGLYYESDWREINSLGVAHAMRCFANHYLGEVSDKPDKVSPPAVDLCCINDTVCDESVIDAIRN